MRRLVCALAAAGTLFGFSRTASADPAALNRAAGLYHQAGYDSARAQLETLLLSGTTWRRRDSLVIFQYLGMSWSRLGADSQAVSRFGDLLRIDSLFRFPRNEDSAVLRNFQAARDRHDARARAFAAGAGTLAAAEAASPPAPAPIPLAMADGDQGPAAPFADPDPRRAHPAGRARPRMSPALGAIPLGGGWLARERKAHGVSLGLIQAGGLILSFYASERQSRMRNDAFGLEASERGAAIGWQWVQGVSLSTAMGAYIFSIIASGGD